MTFVGHHSTRSQHIPIQPILHDHFLARCDNQPVEIHWKTGTFKFAVHTSHPCPLGEVIWLEGVCYGPIRTVHRTFCLFGDISSLLTCLKQKFTSTKRSTLSALPSMDSTGVARYLTSSSPVFAHVHIIVHPRSSVDVKTSGRVLCQRFRYPREMSLCRH